MQIQHILAAYPNILLLHKILSEKKIYTLSLENVSYPLKHIKTIEPQRRKRHKGGLFIIF